MAKIKKVAFGFKNSWLIISARDVGMTEAYEYIEVQTNHLNPCTTRRQLERELKQVMKSKNVWGKGMRFEWKNCLKACIGNYYDVEEWYHYHKKQWHKYDSAPIALFA